MASELHTLDNVQTLKRDDERARTFPHHGGNSFQRLLVREVGPAHRPGDEPMACQEVDDGADKFSLLRRGSAPYTEEDILRHVK